MGTNRKIARIVGMLYILATVAGVLSMFGLAHLNDPDYLISVSANENQVKMGALLYFIMAVAVAGIAIAIYPVLKRYSEALALGYVGARLVEGVLFVVHIITILTLVTLSHEFVMAGAPDASYYQALGEVLLAAGGWAADVLAGLIFVLSALMVNYLLYRSKLVPRWLSGWGLIGAILYPAASLSLFGSPTSGFFYVPLAVQEMVFAIWLIAKGFNPSAIASGSAKTDSN